MILDIADITVSVRTASGGVQKLLRNISLTLEHGGLGAVVGPSGSGKSTLLRAIAGIMECDEGKIFWNGRNLATEGDFEKNELGYVPQFSVAHGALSVREVLLDAAVLRLSVGRAAREVHVDEVLEKCGLGHLAGRRVSVLSGGQLRRLALAMELLGGPALLLCDEVTSGLDARSERDIWELLRSIAEPGRLVLVVTHGLDYVEICDTLTLLNQGGLVFHGSPAEALQRFGVERHEDIFHLLEEQSYEPEDAAETGVDDEVAVVSEVDYGEESADR